MPLLMRYLEGVELAHTSHLAKAYYALENFVENLGEHLWASLAPSILRGHKSWGGGASLPQGPSRPPFPKCSASVFTPFL